MPKQENTAINHLIGYTSRKPIDDIEEPALFSTAPPAARLRPQQMPPLPRRRAPAATPPQVPLHSDYTDDAATTVDPPAGWAAPPVAQPTPPPLPPMPTMPPVPVPTWAQVQPVRPAYPAPHEPPAYYLAPLPDPTMRVRPMPLEVERSLGGEILEWVARLWMPFVAVGVLAMTLGVYRLLNDKPRAPLPITSEAAVVMTPQPVAAVVAEPIAAEPIAAEPVAAEPVTAEPIAAEPAVVDDHGVPKESLWQPTKAQPTFAPRVETVAAIEPAIDVEPAIAEPVTTRKPAARASSERSSSRRAAKRAAAKRASEQRAKQLALAELAPTPKPVKAPKAEVVAIAAAKPMKIGAASAASAAGSGKLTVASTPSTLIYVDGRNTGMMTPKTLSLSEGSHKITLLSPKDRIAKTIAVEIEAGKSANLTKNFTK